MQSVAEFVIAHAQTHPVGLVHQHFLRNHALSCLLHQVGHERLRNVPLKPLLANEARLLRHLRYADLLVTNSCQYSLGSQAAAEQLIEKAAAWDEGDNHHHADDNQDAAQNNLLNGTGLLQKTNHSLETPEWMGESLIIPAARSAQDPSYQQL